MLEATELILSRMETNPEEFGMQKSKWAHIVNYYENVIPKEDMDAIKEGFIKCRQQEYTGEVLKALADEHDKKLSRKRRVDIALGGEHEVRIGNPVEVHDTHDELFGITPVRREGEMARYDSATDSFSWLDARKVSLSSSQVGMAKRLGLSLEEYAKLSGKINE